MIKIPNSHIIQPKCNRIILHFETDLKQRKLSHQSEFMMSVFITNLFGFCRFPFYVFCLLNWPLIRTIKWNHFKERTLFYFDVIKKSYFVIMEFAFVLSFKTIQNEIKEKNWKYFSSIYNFKNKDTENIDWISCFELNL